MSDSMTLARQIGAIARLELAEVLRSRWIWLCAAVYALLAAVFVLVGMRESSVLGFTGMGRVLMSASHALVLLLPLLGLAATGHAINRGRDDGSLELWFSHPLGRGAYFGAVSLVRLLALALPLAVLMPGLALLGRVAFGQAVPWGYLLRALAVSTALLAVSVASGVAVSTFVRNQAKALILVLLLWALGAALLDFALIGMMLQWHVQPPLVFTLAALNPVHDARLALLAGADPELAQLGPVGFWLSNHIGSGGLLALGIGWPLCLALLLWLLGWQRFRTADLV